MLEKFRGAMLGAAIGDALGMPGETGPSTLRNMSYGYRRAWRAHPNAGLSPGQFTDDTQLMLIVADLFARNVYSHERYAEELQTLFRDGRLRFPDTAIAMACEHMMQGVAECGVRSATTGCTSIGLPFALVFDDDAILREQLIQACRITHTHPASHAGAIAFASLIRATLRGSPYAITIAQKNAFLEDEALGKRIQTALDLEREGISLEAALSTLGNDLTVYQTLPISFFLINRYSDVEVLLTVAANIGGNSDTIGFITGAYAGAKCGCDAFPPELLLDLEQKEQIESLSERLYVKYAESINPV